MEEQLILYVRYTAKPGCRESFVRDIVEAGILTQIRQEDGCLAYDYYFSAQDENEVLLIERWESAAHQRVHMEQPHMARLREIKDKYIAATKLDLHARPHPRSRPGSQPYLRYRRTGSSECSKDLLRCGL